jgi:molybdate transport system regulatory protein
MSYRRAWTLVSELNAMFSDAVVDARPGGPNGGGASLTDVGADIVRRYRAIESGVTTTSRAHLRALEKMTAPPVKASRRP